MRALLVPILLVLPFALGIAAANPCDSEGWPALGRVEISPTHDPTRTYYVDDRNFPLGNGIWIYEESNGIFVGGDVTRDLQRGGSTCGILPSTTCADTTDPCFDTRPGDAPSDKLSF